jgi:hypothetical protein
MGEVLALEDAGVGGFLLVLQKEGNVTVEMTYCSVIGCVERARRAKRGEAKCDKCVVVSCSI